MTPKLVMTLEDGGDLTAFDVVAFARAARGKDAHVELLVREGFDVAVCYRADRRLPPEKVQELYDADMEADE